MTENYSSREERRKQQEAAKQKRNSNSNKKKKSKSKGSFFKKLLLVIVALGLIAVISGAATFAYMVKDTPKLDADTLKAAIPSEIYSMDGTFITEIGTQKLNYVEYENIPQLVRDAVIATEDSRFYKHHGIDPIRLTGAVIANVTNGFGAEGGSTITQQVAKMHFLTFEKTLSRKAQEAWLAIQLERKFTKEEIFELYVNKVYMSAGATGIATASELYFGKELKDLTLPEAALIAGMPQSPNNYNPFNHPDKADKRKNIVLSLMNQHGYISEAEMKEAQGNSISSLIVKEEDRKQQTDIPHDPFIGQVIKEIENKYPEINVYTDGLQIYTTLDKSAQEYVDQMMYTNEVIKFPDDKFQAGITLLDTKTGEIRAIGGSRDKEIDFGLNYATSLPRQPGSTIKPVLDYGPAIEYLKWGTYQPIVDEPYKYSTGQTVNNWDRRHMGAMTIREALARSRNIPAVKALNEVGTDKAKEFVNGLGLNQDEIYESSALGGLHKDVTSLQMAGAFSAFGNNGFYTKPHAVKEIIFRDGTKINMKPETEVAMSDYTAFMISDMLKSAVSSPYGTGRAANVPGHHIAGKTGTSNYSSKEKKDYNIPGGGVPDIWFVGYNTNYTISVWTGYEKRKDPIIGRDQQLAKQIFKKLMTQVSKGKETADFKMPDSVVRVKVEKGSANLAGNFTPNDLVAYEYAVKGNAPSQVSKKYKKKEEEKALSGFSAGYDPTANVIRLSWQSSIEGPFNLTMSINGGAEQALPAASEKGYTLANPEPGATYSFRVTSSNGSSLTASVQVPTLDPIEEIIDENIDNENENQNENENNNGNNNSNNGQGNGNNNGNNGNNGQGNGNNNGNNGNNGQGNGNNNGNNGNNGNNNGTPPNPNPVEEENEEQQGGEVEKSKNKYSNNQRNLGKRYQHSRYHQKHKNRIEKKRLRALSFRRFLCDFIHHSFYRFALFMTACFLNNFSISTKASDS